MRDTDSDIGLEEREPSGVQPRVRSAVSEGDEGGAGSEPARGQPGGPSLGRDEADVLGRRIAAALIDLLVVGVLLVIVGVAYHQGYARHGEIGVSLHGASVWVWVLLALSYYAVCETFGGRTIGKQLLGVRVVALRGERLSAGAVAIRTLLRIIDFLPLFYLLGLALIMGTGSRRQRLGDLAARTTVAAVPAAGAEQPPSGRRRLWVWLVPVGLAAIAAVAGVMFAPSAEPGGQALLNTNRLEQKIDAVVRRYTGQRSTTSCPDAVPIHKGLITDCTSTGPDGSKAVMRVQQTDNDGNVSISSPHLMPTSLVEERIAEDASRRLGFAVKVNCPDLVEITKGSEIRCIGTDETGAKATIEVTITDASGNFTYRIRPSRGGSV